MLVSGIGTGRLGGALRPGGPSPRRGSTGARRRSRALLQLAFVLACVVVWGLALRWAHLRWSKNSPLNSHRGQSGDGIGIHATPSTAAQQRSGGDTGGSDGGSASRSGSGSGSSGAGGSGSGSGSTPHSTMHPVTEGLDELDTHAGDVDASDVLPSLGPAHEALALAAWVSEGGYLGWCNSPLRDDAACVPVGALRSPVTGECVNLVQHPFEAALAGSSCVQPSGGQRVCGTHTHIKVSYILTLHDNDALAARALLELFKTAQEVESVEFVVYDDASASVPARVVVTLSRLRSLFGACVVFVRERGEARGFGAANDAAIRAARGELIVLVNTDMYVTPGWLAALTSTLKSTPRAAMAGPLYIGKDNVITEAGGIVFGDANAANYGRYSAPAHDTLYARRVDYISAACLLMRRDTYFDLGGFDPRYERGYYEDTDLALAAANASLLVMYQPGAIVYHQEGSTLGTDESPLKQRLMVENKQKFVDKWDFLLKLKHEYLPYPDAGFVDAAVQRYPELMLWVRDTLPAPLLGVGAARAAALQRALLSIEFHVTIIPSRESDAAALATQARILGADVLEPRPFESADFAPRAGQMIAACRFALLVLSYDAPPAPPPDSANGDNALGSSGGGAAGDAAAARATATRARTLRASCPGMPLILDAPRLRCVARALAHVRPPIPVASVAPMLWRVRSSRAPPAAAALALTAALLPSLPPAGGAAPTSTFARRALGWWAGPAAALPPGLAELCGAELDLLGEVSLALVGSELEREVVVRLRPSLISRVLAVPLADAAAALAPGMLEAEDLGAGGDGETLGTAGTRGAGGRDTHAAGGGSPCAARPLAVLLLASSRAAAEFVTRDVMPVVWGLMLASERAAFSLHIAGYAVEEALSAREGSDEWSARVLMHEPSAAVGQGYMAGVVAGVRLVAAPLLPDDEGVPDSAVAAMASGLPLVTTSLGGHLLGARNGTHAAVTDTPTAFAYALLEVLRCGTGVWDTLAAGGPLLVEPSLSQDATLASHVLEQI